MPAPTTTTSNVSPAGDSTSLTALGQGALLLALLVLVVALLLLLVVALLVVVARQVVCTRLLPLPLNAEDGALLRRAGWQQPLALTLLGLGSSWLTATAAAAERACLQRLQRDHCASVALRSMPGCSAALLLSLFTGSQVFVGAGSMQ
jgi:hypothetical protein